MYTLIKKLLFSLSPEQSHYIALQSLQIVYNMGLSRFYKKIPDHPLHLMGLHFPNRIGLAAGLDKNADFIDALSMLGFGFIEIGTVTPKPQPGNPLPRLFRLTKQEAIINRMGFNSKGVDYVAKKLEQTHYRGILGINIGKNKDTPFENAIDDYLFGFQKLARYASYITINISSPNTPGLRDLQQGAMLNDLLDALKKEQALIQKHQQKYVPLVVKISPDLTEQALQEAAGLFLKHSVDGIIATNTTLHRDGIENAVHANEAGGLSGKPLKNRSTHIIVQLRALLKDNIPIIASGGIMDESSAKEKLNAGARLLQLYTGFIYRGPRLIHLLNSIQTKVDYESI